MSERKVAVEIPLSQGKVALVDAEDVDLVNRYKWHAHKDSRRPALVYATATIADKSRPCGQRSILMHRHLMGVLDTPEVQVDHIDGNSLNNSRANLRLSTQAQNVCNSRNRKRSASGYVGVQQLPSGRWQASVGYNRRLICVGTFDTAELAARARDIRALELHGKFAVLNFPEGI